MDNTRARRHQVTHDAAAIRRVLFVQWDPLGVQNIAGAQDEYDAYIFPIYRLLLAQATDEDIAAYLAQIERDRMGLRLHARQAHLRAVARLLREAISGNGHSSDA